MKALTVILLVLIACAGGAAAEDSTCDVPAYLLFGDSPLNRVDEAVKNEKRLTVAVIGTASSNLAGANGAGRAYPAKLEASLRRRLPGVAVEVQAFAKASQTAADMVPTFAKVLEKKPTLVIWQAGTVDAMRGIDPEEFRTTLDEGVETLHQGGADVILMNMQYSPRTESMIALSAYADNMRAVARERDVPLFDRLAVMRHWNETGTFDLSTAHKDSVMAERVHDCIGRTLASVIIDAAHLGAVEAKAPQ